MQAIIDYWVELCTYIVKHLIQEAQRNHPLQNVFLPSFLEYIIL